MTEWRPVVRPATRAQVDGDIPDVHIIAVRERRVTVDYPTIIQNNVNTDTIELDLDGEWDGMSVVLLLGECPDATELAWHGEPITLPSALAERTGGIDVSVVGYSSDGETRLVTVAAPSLLNVIKSGCTVGEAPAEETPDLIGQLVAAGDAANKAAQTANTAAGAANNAASAANTAAGKADAAATKATDAATEATDAAADATRAAQSANAAAEAAGAAAEAARGNVLKGTLGPARVLSADDAYATKPRRLTVYGETRQNLWTNPSGTSNGITATANDDGSITLSGTSSITSAYITVDSYILRPSTSYTLSIDKAFSYDMRVGCRINNVFTGFSLTAGQTSMTFMTPATLTTVEMGVLVAVSGTTVSGTYRAMLNKGSEPEPWCPPGLNSVDDLSLITAGKNLLDEDAPTVDGVVGPQLPPGDYVLSGTLPSGASLRLLNGGADGETITDTSSLPHAFSSGHPFTPYYAGVGGYATSLMLELGSTATDYEPPNITETPLPEVELRGLPDGTHDELVIKSDGTCEVERNVTEYEVQGTETINVGEYSNGQKYASVVGIAFSSSSSSSLLSDRYSCGAYGTTDKHAYVPNARDLVINDSRFTDDGTAKSILASEKPRFVFVTNQTAEPQSPVTLPTLPAPTVNVYAESSVTGYAMCPDAGMEYERDVTIAFDKLQAQVSALNIMEATNG